jgi:hypothetical protein
MPKGIDEQVKGRAVRLVTVHKQEYLSLTAACEAVASSRSGWVRRACAAGCAGRGRPGRAERGHDPGF